MLPALVLALLALLASVLRLQAYRSQMAEMARILEETPAESNLRLTVRIAGAQPRRLCRAVNARLEQAWQLRLESLQRERELKYTMASISHDIRTPLAGALGYLQLLDEAPEHGAEYLEIVRRRLEELNGLLEELFLYTRLLNNALTPECRETTALLPLENALAEVYPQLKAAGIWPEVRFEQENLQVWASPDALGRIYRNLIANALRHGGGRLVISGRDHEVCFSNPLKDGPPPDPEHLFERFYQGSPSREKGGAGLGLSIVRELMERMGGRAEARIIRDELQIRLLFASEKETAPGLSPG